MPIWWTRRDFLRVVGQGAVATALPAALFAQSPGTVTISVLHTTDLHGHILPTVDYSGRPNLGGFARCAAQIRAWRRANPNSLLLDIGDVYQGTPVSLDSRGALMIRCLNALNYDAWVVGNHEFDWGPAPLIDSLTSSAMPVLSANAMGDGKMIGGQIEPTHPLSRLRPYFIKKIAGFRLAVIGLTTPALATWLPPEDLVGYDVLDPLQTLDRILPEVTSLHPDAILVAGHMGLKRRDDYANQVGELTRRFPQITAYLGAHTHQNHPGEWINGVLYTQADHYGIHAGKIDLTFELASRRLVSASAETVLMDDKIAFDPLVLSLSQHDLQLANHELQRDIGELTDPLASSAPPGQPSDQQRLIGSAIADALRRQNVAIDAVAHGLFDPSPPFPAGRKTVADVWALLPYENQVVTVDLAQPELIAVAEKLLNARPPLVLMGLRADANLAGGRWKITALHKVDGSPLPPQPTYRLALNSYDSQSGGGRYPLLGQMVADSQHHRRLYTIQIRDAVIDFFLERQKVERSAFLV